MKFTQSILLSIILILTAANPAFSQNANSSPGKNGVPVKWQKYSVPKHGVTVLLPKMPVKIVSAQACFGEETTEYAAYAEGKAYVFSITREIDVPRVCRRSQEFSASNFKTRRESLIQASGSGNVVDVKTGAGMAGVRIHAGYTKYFLFDDIKNNRWFELHVVAGDTETAAAEKDFIASLILEKKTTGIDIGDGSPHTLGDEITPEQKAAEDKARAELAAKMKAAAATDDNPPGPGTAASGPDKSDADKNEVTKPTVSASPVIIVMKPRPSYTEEARRAKTNGVVRLKVVFYSNGAIGSVEPVITLKHGLTEQAIAAARRIVFIPARREKTFYTVAKIVEYNFNLF